MYTRLLGRYSNGFCRGSGGGSGGGHEEGGLRLTTRHAARSYQFPGTLLITQPRLYHGRCSNVNRTVPMYTRSAVIGFLILKCLPIYLYEQGEPKKRKENKKEGWPLSTRKKYIVRFLKYLFTSLMFFSHLRWYNYKFLEDN